MLHREHIQWSFLGICTPVAIAILSPPLRASRKLRYLLAFESNRPGSNLRLAKRYLSNLESGHRLTKWALPRRSQSLMPGPSRTARGFVALATDSSELTRCCHVVQAHISDDGSPRNGDEACLLRETSFKRGCWQSTMTRGSFLFFATH